MCPRPMRGRGQHEAHVRINMLGIPNTNMPFNPSVTPLPHRAIRNLRVAFLDEAREQAPTSW